MGAWIEIEDRYKGKLQWAVAPLAGAWIEMIKSARTPGAPDVAPLAGAWIEIFFIYDRNTFVV